MKPSNVLNIKTLSEEWTDKDMVILHACFQLLNDCVENENLFDGHINWTIDDEQLTAKFELEKLYNWWQSRKDRNDCLDKEQYEEDNKMLIKLIMFRKYLWT